MCNKVLQFIIKTLDIYIKKYEPNFFDKGSYLISKIKYVYLDNKS